MCNLRISLLQTDIVWEDKEQNLKQTHEYIKRLEGSSDLAVLPEQFSTGFTMNSRQLAEPANGKTITALKSWAARYNIAITGSYIAGENNTYYNRAFFFTPEGESYFYDKRHLFRMGDETAHFSPGNTKAVIPYRGWNICVLICYDLRFPVWSRNVDNQYDLLIYVGNWPASRQMVWDTLLPARAMENMSYVCGVNRVGTDGNGLSYGGGSILYSPRGEVLASFAEGEQGIVTTGIDLVSLKKLRDKFPAWKDADRFSIYGIPEDRLRSL